MSEERGLEMREIVILTGEDITPTPSPFFANCIEWVRLREVEIDWAALYSSVVWLASIDQHR